MAVGLPVEDGYHVLESDGREFKRPKIASAKEVKSRGINIGESASLRPLELGGDPLGVGVAIAKVAVEHLNSSECLECGFGAWGLELWALGIGAQHGIHR